MHATRRLRTTLKWSALGATGAVVAAALVRHAVQPVHATADEHIQRLPGDDLIANPLASLTNAVTIHATPRAVWSWLAQMGAGRAGWYSFDGLDNGGHSSATSIVPALQRLDVGMVFPALPGATDGFTLAAFELERFLILDWKTPDGLRLVSWAFVLEPLDGGSTRLIVRARGGSGYRFFGMPPSVTTRIIPIIHAVHFMMQRKQLLGIATRAESRAAS
jgi:hypothetical protein